MFTRPLASDDRAPSRKRVRFHDICLIAAIFLFSRLVVVFGMLFGRKFIVPPPPFDAAVLLQKTWWESVILWDAGCYIDIAMRGYEYAPDGHPHSIAFFPLYPLTIRAVHRVLDLDPVVLGMMLSNVCFFLSLVILKLYTDRHHPESDSRLTVLLTALCPFGVFFSTTYAESQLLFLFLLSLLLFRGNRLLSSACVLSLAGATKLSGLFILPSLLWSRFAGSVFRSKGVRSHPDTRELMKTLAWASVAISSFLLFLVYQHVAFGHWDAFIRVQKGFNRPHVGTFGGLLTETKLDLFSAMNMMPAAAVLVLSVLFFFIERYRMYALWGLLVVLVPLSTGTVVSMTRYTMVFFPMFIFVAQFVRGKPLLRDFTVISFCAALFMFTSLFVRHYFIG